MTIMELVQRARQAAPRELGPVPDEAARALLREAFSQIRARLAATDEGTIAVAGLGRFRVLRPAADGDRSVRTRAIFRAEGER